MLPTRVVEEKEQRLDTSTSAIAKDSFKAYRYSPVPSTPPSSVYLVTTQPIDNESRGDKDNNCPEELVNTKGTYSHFIMDESGSKLPQFIAATAGIWYK